MPEPPLAAEILTRPAEFGKAVTGTPSWQYWPAPVVAALLSGLCYALLLRPSLNLAAQAANGAPVWLTHLGNAFGSVFLTALTFGALWGLGALLVRRTGERLPLTQIWSATFTLPLLLALPVLALIALTPAEAWALDSARVAAAHGDFFALQRAALSAAAQTPAALVLIGLTLVGVAAQCLLAYLALRSLTPRAALLVGLPFLPALGLALLGLLPILLARAS